MPKSQKNAEIFICEKCDFKCSRQSNYTKHLMTRKHKILTNTYTDTYIKNANIYSCDCGKEYKHRQSLNNHKKICTYVFEPEPKPEPEIKEKTLVTQEKTTEEKLLECIEKQGKLMEKQSQVIEKLTENIETSQPKVINNYLYLLLGEI